MPKDLWSKYGESKRFSLKTTSPSEAKKLALEQAAYWHARFRAERGEDADALSRLERSAEAIRRDLRRRTLSPKDADALFEADVETVLEGLAHLRGRDEETGHPLVTESEEARLERAIGPVRSAIANPSYRTLGESIAEHLAETGKVLGIGTLRDRTTELRKLEEHYGAHFDMDQLSESGLRRYVAEHMRGKGKTKTIQRRFSNLRVFLDWLKDRGYLETRFPDDLRNAALSPRAANDSESSDPWPEELIIEFLRDPKVRPTMKALAIMRLYSGCRPEALASLETDRVEADRIRIIGDKNHPRTIPIHPTVQPLYAALKAKARDSWLIPGQKPAGKNQTREFAIGRDVGRWLKKRKEAGTLKANCTWYGLRHTFVTRWRNDLDLREEVMQELIGQKPRQSSIADKHYRARFTIEKLAAELEKFGWPEAIEAICSDLISALPDAVKGEPSRRGRGRTT